MYTKAITAFITSVLGMLAVLNVPIDLGWVSQALIGAVAVIINTFLVWRLPNTRPNYTVREPLNK